MDPEILKGLMSASGKGGGSTAVAAMLVTLWHLYWPPPGATPTDLVVITGGLSVLIAFAVHRWLTPNPAAPEALPRREAPEPAREDPSRNAEETPAA